MEGPNLPAHIRAYQAAGFRIAALFAGGRLGLFPAGLVDVPKESFPEGLSFLFKSFARWVAFPVQFRLEIEVADEPMQIVGMKPQ